MKLTYIGGPTVLIEWGGVRLLTDPTFDPAGSEYPTPAYSLRKTLGPAVAPEALGPVDAVLLSHDHHWDNLDHAGRVLLQRTARVITTPEGAARLQGAAIGLAPGNDAQLSAPDGRTLLLRAIKAQHGPAEHERGPVTGFAAWFTDAPQEVLYVSGDTVWHDGLEALQQEYSIHIALLFAGAARVTEVGPDALTLTATEAVRLAQALPDATVVPVHYEGWQHFSEDKAELSAAFAQAGLTPRVLWLSPGVPTPLPARP